MTDYADPPDMPEDERMTPAEFKVVREFLGVSGDWLAAHLGVTGKTVRNWEAGKYEIPDGVRLKIEDLEQRTAEWIGQLVEKLLDMPEPTVVTYRTDAEYGERAPDAESRPGVHFPAGWHRAVCARVAQEVPALSIVYASDVPVEVAR
ncbi:helix-turn-helix domain-containing protein [Streptomyces sp. 4N509B]|uniref:helix-turn-helix domain-containing protein n=1 Tax=Streptomyces sp. 4N509B TaxID=3457413 RepID=UPI003FD2D4A0